MNPSTAAERLAFLTRAREAFASEHGYRAQQSVYQGSLGPDARVVLREELTALPPCDALEVGCGEGELASWLTERGHRTVALDVSPRMARLASTKGVSTLVAALPDLPFPNDSFDCVVGAWVLHYLPSALIDASLRELARVARPGAFLCLTTNANRHMEELWSRVPRVRYRLSFPAEEAARLLDGVAHQVRVTEVEGTVTFESLEQAREFIRPQVAPPSIADALEPFEPPLEVTRRAAVITGRFRP
ncbi:class I SAM-dependent methyltransferase [Streptomyces hainanensis]|uniref:Class I SAM-dependent methyltransferase n=1 Tax=Streptomyces hainanensis TaxID=402648 RepID=A0A4R4TLU2_9ACTN|nr:class I SAM-dependent methyltransferase [Streptomyces hainanensis]TDC79018.1 class I SAM-dependent methyltransferase [Streptomyces hainanensis]